MAQNPKLCTADEFAELSPMFRVCCRGATVVASPVEARLFARMKGKAYNWFTLQVGGEPSEESWKRMIKSEATKIREVLKLARLTTSTGE